MKYIESSGLDPYYNLALEEHLIDRCEPGERILYLWRNDRTVVIGRNQDPWAECPVDLLEKEGVNLARRKSGGGAVYHDQGNLNYTFIAWEGDENVDRQMGVVQTALRELGVDAEFSGRNDILVNGRKVSGNAFQKRGGVCCHHGTLMVNVDLEAVERYLSPSADKLSAKGIASVRSRVVNLRELVHTITLDRLREAILESCRLTFGKLETIQITNSDLAEIQRRMMRFSDPKWIFGEKKRYDRVLQRRFAWGGVTIGMNTDCGKISAVQVRSDAMDPRFAQELKKAMLGIEVNRVADAVRQCANIEAREDIAEWLAQARGEVEGGKQI